MRTSGAGTGGALIAVAGAVALGLTGCSSNTGGTKTSDTVQQAAAGANASSTVTSTAPSTPAPTPTSAPTSSSASSSESSSAAKPSSSAPHSSSRPSTKPTSTEPSTHPTTPKQTPTKPKPSKTTPTKKGGSGWLAGVPLGSNTPGALDSRCKTGRVVCIDMETRTLLWVVDGKPQYGMDVRFGDENEPTRKGKFDLYMKMEHCISTIYHTSMPDAMFFSGGEAVHFSIDFATYGYAHHSHGCVNVRDRAAVERLFADTRVGDKVVVY